MRLTLSFWYLWSRRLLKSLWQKKNLLIGINVSFFRSVFQLCSVITLSLVKVLYIFVNMFFKSSAGELVHIGKYANVKTIHAFLFYFGVTSQATSSWKAIMLMKIVTFPEVAQHPRLSVNDFISYFFLSNCNYWLSVHLTCILSKKIIIKWTSLTTK